MLFHRLCLPLQLQHLPAVLMALGVADVQPVVAGLLVALHDQLIEGEVLLDERHILLQFVIVRHIDIGSLAQTVLRVGYSAYHIIQTVGTVTTDDDNFPVLLAQRLQNLLTQCAQSGNDYFWLIQSVQHTYTVTGVGVQHLPHGEVISQVFLHVQLSFRSIVLKILEIIFHGNLNFFCVLIMNVCYY